MSVYLAAGDLALCVLSVPTFSSLQESDTLLKTKDKHTCISIPYYVKNYICSTYMCCGSVSASYSH